MIRKLKAQLERTGSSSTIQDGAADGCLSVSVLFDFCCFPRKRTSMLVLSAAGKKRQRLFFILVLCFTETWLCGSIPDSALQLAGFQLLRADRDTELEEGWRNVLLPQQRLVQRRNSDPATMFSCSGILLNQLLLSPGVRFIHPGRCLHSAFKQFIKCPTREENTLDHCYTTASRAYYTVPPAALGHSDHVMVHLIPAYRQKLKLCKPVVRESRKWTSEALEDLRACFDCTDWDVFRTASDNPDEFTEAITFYISFCEDICVPSCTREAAREGGETRLCLSVHQHRFPPRLRSFPSALLPVHEQLHLQSPVLQAPEVC
ncbi:uncharacterized protein LOC134105619 [Pungitius pungitius]|uniref:uncharacterized protein LOC134105619 n=1 Tax=Pungitius pungitius TaxID=134920 RepID=UPI002E15C65E